MKKSRDLTQQKAARRAHVPGAAIRMMFVIHHIRRQAAKNSAWLAAGLFFATAFHAAAFHAAILLMGYVAPAGDRLDPAGDRVIPAGGDAVPSLNRVGEGQQQHSWYDHFFISLEWITSFE